MLKLWWFCLKCYQVSLVLIKSRYGRMKYIRNGECLLAFIQFTTSKDGLYLGILFYCNLGNNSNKTKKHCALVQKHTEQ